MMLCIVVRLEQGESRYLLTIMAASVLDDTEELQPDDVF